MSEQLIELDKLCKPAPGAIFPFGARRYRQLAEEEILPPVRRGKVEFLRACRDLFAHQQALIDGRSGGSMSDEKKRLTRINADRKELQLQKERGELINTETAMKLWGTVCANMRSKLLAVPSKLAPLVFALKSIAEVKARMEKSIHEVLNELANPDLTEISRVGGNKPRARNTKASTGPTGKRMGRRKEIPEPGKQRRARQVVHRPHAVHARADGRDHRS